MEPPPPSAPPSAPPPAVAPQAKPAEPGPEPPRQVTLAEGRIVQLLQHAAGVPTREAVATWQVGGETLRVFTRHRDRFIEDPSERMGIASVHVRVQVIVARGARKQVVLATEIANMLSLLDQETVAVFAAPDGDELRVAIDMMRLAGNDYPEPPRSVRARVSLRNGRIAVHDRWQGDLTELPQAQELLQAGVPWPKAAIALTAERGELVWWDAKWKVLHRQPGPTDAQLLPTGDGVTVVTPSELWRIERDGSTALRKRIPLPSVEPELRQMADYEDRAVVTRVDPYEDGLCVQIAARADANGDQATATYAIDEKGVARGWVTSERREQPERTPREPPCVPPPPPFEERVDPLVQRLGPTAVRVEEP